MSVPLFETQDPPMTLHDIIPDSRDTDFSDHASTNEQG